MPNSCVTLDFNENPKVVQGHKMTQYNLHGLYVVRDVDLTH